jgi:hypothetical protein
MIVWFGTYMEMFSIYALLLLKDRLGDQRGGGSEWEPIKILLEGD